jgi:uncharacterized protein YcbK (DUF882 family)
MRKMGTLSRNFDQREFECKCCGLYISSIGLVQTLQNIRDAVGAPVIINSGTRCKKHNAAVGGVANSAHLTGEAADIQVNLWPQQRLYDKIKGLHEVGLLPWLSYCYRIKGSKGAVHVGIDNKKRVGGVFQ